MKESVRKGIANNSKQKNESRFVKDSSIDLEVLLCQNVDDASHCHDGYNSDVMMARTTEHHDTDTLRVLVHERELCPPIDESKKVSSFSDWEDCDERGGDAIIDTLVQTSM